MVANIVNLLSRAFSANNLRKTTALTPVSNANPFSNPFVTSATAKNYAGYAKNKPVQGGYFAGYHNGKPNIVGQRLFLEV